MDDTFERELRKLINKYSLENGSNTPDLILAHYLSNCLKIFDVAIKKRENWYGTHHKPGFITQ